MLERALTIIPASFADDENPCIDSVGKEADHNTEQKGRNRDEYIASILGIDEIGLYSCRWR